MMSIILIFFFILAVTFFLSFLQIFLSRKKSKWPGLILPAIFIILSLILVTYFLRQEHHYPSTSNTVTHFEYDNEGNIKEEFKKIDDSYHGTSWTESPSIVVSGIGMITILITTNIPTVIFLLIYGISREKMRAKLEMQKMAIQDLN